MATQPQTIVEPAAPVDKPLGARNQENLSKIFSESPLPGYLGDVTDDERKDIFGDLALDGSVQNGLGLNSFDRDYANNGAPNLDDVETGGSGLPATPYVPNLNSPGPGSVFPGDQAPYEGTIPESAPEFGSGLGGLQSPSTTSKEIQAQTLGAYITGRSYAGSDGSA